MRLLTTFLFLVLFLNSANGQTATEVYLFDLSFEDGMYSISSPINVSANPGYDNQPHFSVNGKTLYFTSNRDGETDLVSYSVESGGKTWLTNTPDRSEYSPTVTPDKYHLSFISLTSDGVQEFRKINLDTGDEDLIEAESIIGYFVWIDSKSYLCFVLATEDSPSTLQLHNIETGKKSVLAENPGRSFHKIPGAKAFSYILNEENKASIYAYYLEAGTSDYVAPVIAGSQDMAWTPNGNMLMGAGSILYTYSGNSWEPVADLKEYGLTGITRLAVSGSGGKIAIVVEE